MSHPISACTRLFQPSLRSWQAQWKADRTQDVSGSGGLAAVPATRAGAAEPGSRRLIRIGRRLRTRLKDERPAAAAV
jgi:hypothetical protein